MPKPGIALSTEAARLGIGHPRRVPDAWTPWRDPLAEADAAVRARMRFLFAPLALPTLSAAGARAGLGPDGPTGKDRPTTDGVDTRPDPRLDRPIVSRIPGADIGEAAQMAEAERMGVHVPVEAPVLSANGKNAGLGAFAASSSSPKAAATASTGELETSRSKVRMAGRKSTAMVSMPVPAMSDASGRVGITGKNPIPASGRGFAMRVPKGPVAQDRERWESGTSDRISAASKGLSLANMEWSDHRGTPPKPQPKRTWVGKQGDATECPENCKEACADLAVAPHAAVNKGTPLRELEKETAPSDVCPLIRSSVGTLEGMVRRDALALAKSPEELLRLWASRAGAVRGRAGGPSSSSKPAASAATGLATLASGAAMGLAGKNAKSCGCSDCGCSGGVEKNGMPAMSGRPTYALPSRGADSHGVSAIDSARNAGGGVSWHELAALVESFAVRHGTDGNSEWFAPVFLREGRLVLGMEQRGPSSSAWHPDPNLGMRSSDRLVATFHTHTRSAAFSENDRRTGDILRIPMILIAPGAERVRVYDPASRAIAEVILGKGMRTLRKVTTGIAAAGTSGDLAQSSTRSGSTSTMGDRGITISAPDGGGSNGPVENARAPITISIGGLESLRTVFELRLDAVAKLIDIDLLARTVELAYDNPNASDVFVYWTLAAEWVNQNKTPKVAPDVDLLRNIIGVAQKRVRARRDFLDVFDDAVRSPLFVEPDLLDLIVKYAATRQKNAHDVWASAWSDRIGYTRYVGYPTPPDLNLFLNIIEAARFSSDPKQVLSLAHFGVGRLDSSVWPRNISPDFLRATVWVARSARAAEGEDVQNAAYYIMKLAGAPLPPEPHADATLIDRIIKVARDLPYHDPREVLNLALGAQLEQALLEYDCGDPGQRCCGEDSCNGSALCDWDGICKTDLWPAPGDYVSNQTWPGEELDTDWTEELQGLASDGSYWYVVQGDEKSATERALWKVPLDIDFTEDWGDLPGVRKVDALLPRLAALQCLHWGDPDVHQGRVYVPMEECPGGHRLAEFDARTLELLGSTLTHTLHAASVAIHPRTHQFYMMNHFYLDEPEEQRRLYVYKARGSGPFALGEPIRKLTLEGAELDGIQGIAFSPSGKLYVSADGNLGPGVYGFQIGPETSNRAIFQRYMPIEAHLSDVCSPFGSGEELEGLTVVNVAGVNPDTGQLAFRHQIHLFLLHNICGAKDNAWFKHVSVVDRSRV